MGEIATRKLTERQAAFVQYMAETGDVQGSALKAELSPDHGYALIRQPHVLAEVHSQARRKIIASAPLALKFIVDLIKDETADRKLRHDAAWRITQMAGHVAPRAAAEKPADQPLHEMTTDQLRELAGRLEDEIAGRAKPVSSVDAAPPIAENVDVIG